MGGLFVFDHEDDGVYAIVVVPPRPFENERRFSTPSSTVL
jgi:hypothetical protein